MRFEDIREVLQSTPEPIEACKVLTERANQAGGHDNITVIVVRFDGEGLRASGFDAEPHKYRKYALPEVPNETAEPHRRTLPEMLPIQSRPPGAGSSAPQGLESTFVSLPSVKTSSPSPTRRDGPRASAVPSRPEDELIEIPGTHVPAWVVAALVIGVMLILAATAFLFLR